MFFIFQVLFSKAAEDKIRHQAKEEKDNIKREAATMLENTIDLINQVGLKFTLTDAQRHYRASVLSRARYIEFEGCLQAK